MSTAQNNNAQTTNALGEISSAEFYEHYWHKKPLLIRQAFPNFVSPISPDELAGLACEAEVNSRIVIEKGGTTPWQVIQGPMDEAIFEKMPESHWTLLINDIEKYLPEFALITDQFRFIPEWYFDDLMTSWAAPQGTVGPHFDLYDVFILQGDGQRRWQLNTQMVEQDNWLEDVDVRLLKDFEAEIEWVLEPGDMIYIPAGVSHHGVSLNESISFSIGFRAPSHTDLVNDFLAHLTNELSVDKTYQLSKEDIASHPNEISSHAINKMREIFKHYLDPNHPDLTRWFGRYFSDPKIDFIPDLPEPVETINQLNTLVKQEQYQLLRYPGSRYAFTELSPNTELSSNTVYLFVDGEEFEVSREFACLLCDQREISLSSLITHFPETEQQLIVSLYNTGKLYLADL